MNSKVEYAGCVNECPGQLRTVHKFGSYGVCKCESCSLVFLNPRLPEEQLESFYEDQYFNGTHETGYSNYEGDKSITEKTFVRRVNFIRRFKTAGRILDVGCSLGFFLDVAQRSGFEGWGIDCSKYAINQSKSRFPNRVFAGVLNDEIFDDKSFDVITMFDVFEHVYDPHKLVRQVHRILKDDGILIITTPNQDSILAKLTGKKWVSYKIPEHVFYYTPQTLTQIVSPLFSVEMVKPEGQYCSLEFLSARLTAVNKFVGSTVNLLANSLGMRESSLFVNSGSMTAVLRPKIILEHNLVKQDKRTATAMK